jgi:ATP synthase protein I
MVQCSKLTHVGYKSYTYNTLLGAGTANAMLRDLSRPIRTVLRWQVMATAVVTLVAGALAGVNGALSAALGGSVSIFSGLASAFVAELGRAESAGGALFAALSAETIKIGLIVFLLWLVLAMYRDVIVLALVGSFVLTVLIFAMAFFVRDV